MRSLAAALLLAVAAASPAAAVEPPAAKVFAETRQAVAVRVAVPDPAEVQRIFGVPLDSRGIQAVWVEIANHGEDGLAFLPIETDPTYFSPLEASWRFHDALRPEADAARDRLFMASHIPLRIAAGATASGYVFTHRETGLKFVNVTTIRAQDEIRFHFIVPVTGPELAVERIALDRIYPPEQMRDVDLDALRQALAGLPCCGSNADGTGKADPLNIVVVADPDAAAFPFVSRGWRFVQPLDLRSAAASAEAFVLDAADPNLPVSPMWVFGRREDLALQKPRDTISQRNHLRLWLTPLRYEGEAVFIGQISRDVGVELTDKSWYGTTHRIDGAVDFDRDYLLQDLLLSGAVARFGYVTGVGVSTATAPRVNLVGDPYITDGLRLVVMLGPVRSRFLPLETLGWDTPPAP